MIYAFMRVLYEDYLNLAIESMPGVDRIFCFWTDKPWGRTFEIEWKGETVNLAKQVCDPSSWTDPRVIAIKAHQDDPANQFTNFANEHILSNYPRPDKLIFLEADWVWRADQWEKALEQSDDHDVCRSRHVELWRKPTWSIMERPGRSTAVFWNLARSGITAIPRTRRAGDIAVMPILDAYLHNLGFCLTPGTMLYKHLAAMAFSRDIQDSQPDPAWYDRWLNWKPSDTDLEISLGHAHAIHSASPYPPEWLPELMR